MGWFYRPLELGLTSPPVRQAATGGIVLLELELELERKKEARACADYPRLRLRISLTVGPS